MFTDREFYYGLFILVLTYSVGLLVCSCNDVAVEDLPDPKFEFLQPDRAYAADEQIPVQFALQGREADRHYLFRKKVEFFVAGNTECSVSPSRVLPGAGTKGIATAYVSCHKDYQKPIVVFVHHNNRVYAYTYVPGQSEGASMGPVNFNSITITGPN